jgi:alanyl-tRNA synthetase
MISDATKQVKPLYMSQASLLEHKAIITNMGISEINKTKYQWIELNETIFHPKGGGQLSDEGTIDGIRVAYIHKELPDKSQLTQFQILHCFDENQHLPFEQGDEVELKVDPSKRKEHSQLHTAGHIVAEAVNKHFPQLEGYQGNHCPGNCYVRFRMLDPAIQYDKEEIRQKSSAELCSWIEQDLPIFQQISPAGMRLIKITQDWSACGGTHVDSLKALDSIEISDVSINKKELTVTVKYKKINQ